MDVESSILQTINELQNAIIEANGIISAIDSDIAMQTIALNSASTTVGQQVARGALNDLRSQRSTTVSDIADLEKNIKNLRKELEEIRIVSQPIRITEATRAFVSATGSRIPRGAFRHSPEKRPRRITRPPRRRSTSPESRTGRRRRSPPRAPTKRTKAVKRRSK